MTTITRYHDISAGHRVVGHEGKCVNLHGHNYRVHFEVAAGHVGRRSPDGEMVFFRVGDQPETDDVGRVIDFSVIKARLCRWLEDNWDHRMLLWEDDPLGPQLSLLDPFIAVVPFNPTAENMARHLVDVVGPDQLRDTGVALVSARVDETRKCSATYTIGTYL